MSQTDAPTPGITGFAEVTVTAHNTAETLKSGDLPVFSTAALAALMEQAAYTSVAPFLDAGSHTVGTRIEVRHLAASPVGASIRAESTLTAVSGRLLTFALRAFDNAGLIAEGTHERAVVTRARFLEKAASRI